MSRSQAVRKREKVSLIQLNAPVPMLEAFSEHASEEALIGAVLQRPDVFAALAEHVQAADFSHLFNGYAWHAFDQLTAAGKGIDFQTVADAIEHAPQSPVQPGEAMPRLIEYMGRCPDARHAGVYAERVLEAALRMRMLKATEDAKALALDKTKRADEIIDGVDRLIYAATSRVVDEPSDAKSITEAYFTEVENALNHGVVAGTAWGFGALDEKLGGLMPGHVVVIAAPAGAGKTTLALSLIRQMVGKGKRMALFSLEMAKSEIIRSLIAMEAPLDRLNLMAYKLVGNDFAKFLKASSVVSAYPLDIIDEYPQMTPLQLRRRLRRLCAAQSLDVVFVDGLWLMNADQPTEKRNEDVMSIMKELMSIARDFAVPIVIMHQLNREATKRNNKEPQLNDLAESIGVSQTAVMVMALYRPTYYDPEHADTSTYLRVLKSRFVNANGLRFVMAFDKARECYSEVHNA